MKLRLDKQADALYMRFHDSKIIESEEIAPGVIVDFDSKNNVVGVEVLHLSKRTTARKRPAASASHPAVVREKQAKKYRA